MAVIDLRDFETKQILKNPVAISDHFGSVATPNTEHVIGRPVLGAPGWRHAPLDQYQQQ